MLEHPEEEEDMDVLYATCPSVDVNSNAERGLW